MCPCQVIARLGALSVLNASAVTPHERKDSELRYLRGVLGAHTVRRVCLPCHTAFKTYNGNLPFQDMVATDGSFQLAQT